MNKKVMPILSALILGVGLLMGARVEASGAEYPALSSGSRNITLGSTLQYHHPVAWWMVNRLADRLELSTGQKEAIAAIFAAQVPGMQPYVEQLIRNRSERYSTVAQGQFDEAAARAFAERQSLLITELIVTKERIRAQVYGVLTEAQREEVDEMSAQFEQWVKELFTG